MKIEKKSKIFHSSLILSGLDRLSLWVYKRLTAGVFGKIFTGYDKTEQAFRSSFTGNLLGRSASPDRRRGEKRRRIVKMIENSFAVRSAKNINARLRCYSLRVYAMFLMSFGIYTALMYLIKAFAMRVSDISEDYVFVSFVCAVIAIALFTSGKTLGKAACESKMMSFLLFRVLGQRREDFEKAEYGEGKKNIAFVLGMFLGALTYFVRPVLIIAALAGILIFYLTLDSPETGLIITLFILPFLIILPHPSIILSLMVLFIAFSYFFKLARGKRVARFDMLDGFVLIFTVTMLLGGAVDSSRSFPLQALLYSCLMIGYFLCAGLLTTKKLIIKAVISLVSSASIVSLYGIYQYLSGNVESTWLDTEMFAEIQGRAVSFFENPNMLGEYIILIFPLAFALMLAVKKRMHRTLLLIAVAVMGGCLVVTWARGAWLGLIIGMFVLFMILGRKTLIACFLGLFALPFVPFVLPSEIWDRLSSIGNMKDSSTAYRVHIWEAAVKMLKDHWFSGIGVGENSFTVIYAEYTLSGIEKAPHSHNLFLQIAIETGIFGILAFVALAFFYVQGTFTFIKKGSDGLLKLLSAGAMCGFLSALAQGMTDYVWYNYRVFFIFFAVAGIGAACRKCGQRTLSHGYLPDENTVSYAEMDIEINERG